MRVIGWISFLAMLIRLIPADVNADTTITSVTTSVQTSPTSTVTSTTTRTVTNTNASSSTSTYTMPVYVPPKPLPPPPPPPKEKKGMCEGDQAMGCAAAAAPALMGLLGAMKGADDKGKGDSKCPPGGDAGKGGADAASKCARENETAKAKAKGKK